MKPIPSEASREAFEMLAKAQQLAARIEAIEKAVSEDAEGGTFPFSQGTPRSSKRGKMQGERTPREGARETGEFPLPGTGDDAGMSVKAAKCDCGKEPCECKSCPKCGSKMAKAGCVKSGCGGTMQKAEPGFITTFNSEPQGVTFVAESGGQTRNAYYNTNQYEYGGKDVANKGATSESFNIDALASKMNPHDGGGADRQVTEGVLSKAVEALQSANDMLEKAICRECGGNKYTGCRFGFGADCPGLDEAEMPRPERRHDPSDYSRSVY